MISFTLRFTNVPAEARYRFAQYHGEWLPEFSRLDEFTPIKFVGVPAQGDLLVKFFSRGDEWADELLFTNRTFENGATYTCDYATRELYESAAPPEPPAEGGFNLWWLAIPGGLAAVGTAILIARRKRH